MKSLKRGSSPYVLSRNTSDYHLLYGRRYHKEIKGIHSHNFIDLLALGAAYLANVGNKHPGTSHENLPPSHATVDEKYQQADAVQGKFKLTHFGVLRGRQTSFHTSTSIYSDIFYLQT